MNHLLGYYHLVLGKCPSYNKSVISLSPLWPACAFGQEEEEVKSSKVRERREEEKKIVKQMREE